MDIEARRIRTPLLLACAIALAVIAGCGSSDGDGTNVAATGPEPATQATTAADGGTGPTRAVLRPVGGNKASGTVAYEKTPANMPLLRIRLRGLEQTTAEEKYVLWQASSRHDMVPIATYTVEKNGILNENLKAGFESLAYLEDGSRTELMVTKVADDDTWREGLGGGGQGVYDPSVPGKFILRGPLTGSLVGAAE